MGRAACLGLAGTLTAALALRLYFIVTPHGVIDADEAIVGLMARHILRGEFPIFYYGQTYMGSLEANLAALAFALGGASPLVLKLSGLAQALVLVGLTAELGRRTLGAGLGLVAGLFVALPPMFLTVWTLKTRGGFVATLVLGTVILLLAHRAVEASGRRRARAVLILGLTAGLGWWTCQLIVSYLAAACVMAVRGIGLRAVLRLLPIPAVAFIAGSLPMWIHAWLGQSATRSVWALVDIATAGQQLGQVFTIGLPALLGPGAFWPALPDIRMLTAPMLAIYGLAWLLFLGTRVRAWHLGRETVSAADAALDALAVLPVITALACGLSRSGWFVSEPRYLLPIAAVVPLYLAALLAALWRRGWRRGATALGAMVLAVNLAGQLLAPWITPREAPASLEPALAFFAARGIPIVATSYWIGPRLSFESGERVVGVPLRGGPDRYPPHTARARQTDPLAYALLVGVRDVENRVQTLGFAREQTSLGDLTILHDLRLPGLGPAPPGLAYEALEVLSPLEARLRIAALYEAAGQADRALAHLETALREGLYPGSDGVDRLVRLYRATGRSAEAATLAARRVETFTPARARETDFDDAIRLHGFTLSSSAVRAGEGLTVTSFWSARQPLDSGLSLAIRLSDGRRRVSGDVAPLGHPYPATSWQPGELVRHSSGIAFPRHLPPGLYALRVRLWSHQEGRPAPRPRRPGEAAGSEWLTLTEVEVLPPA